MKILDIALKDLLRSFRSVFAVGMMLVAPLLITGLIYFAFGGLSAGTGSFNLPPLKIILVNLDQPAGTEVKLGQMLIDFFNDESMPNWLQTSENTSLASARDAVDQQEAGVAVIVPVDFTQSLVDGKPTTLTLIQDPTLTIGPQIVKDILAQFIDGVSGTRILLMVTKDQLVTRGLQLSSVSLAKLIQEYSAWYTALSKNLHHSDRPLLSIQNPSSGQAAQENPIQKMMGQIMAGQMIFFAFFTGAITAQSILKEDEEGTLPRLFTTPTPRSVILSGKFVSVFITVFVQVVVLLCVSELLFHIDWGQPMSIALALLGLVVGASGLGLLILSFIKNTRQSGPVLGGLLAMTGMLGGLFTANIIMPQAFTRINMFFPQGWAMRSWTLAIAGASPAEVLPSVLVSLALGAVMFTAGVFLFRRRYS
jgi:ABC-2 type transport system permease protein